jgi:ParB family transcriptional regulator, chromosome partitioning protein
MAAKKKAAAKPKAPAGAKKAPTRGKRKAAPAGSAGLDASSVAALSDGDTDKLAKQIEADGGAALAKYKDPLFGRPVIFAVLPMEKVQRTTFQRDVSESHVDRLADAIKRTGVYLDPVIAVRAPDGMYVSPNGGHRLSALTRMGAKSITALVVPDEKIAFKILALNTEKAHALKEKALEAIRMLRALAPFGGTEESFAGELEEPNFLTLGAAYEKRPRLSGSAYNPFLKRVEGFLTNSLEDAIKERERRGQKLIDFDDVVTPIVEELRAKGFDSPGLRQVVLSRVARLPPKGKKIEATFDEAFDEAIQKAKDFDPSSLSMNDVAGAAGGGGDD